MTVRVTVVVVNWNGADLLEPCLDSLAAQTVPHRVLVVDNGSTDSSRQVLAQYPAVEVLYLDTNTGFAGGAQAGLDGCATEYAAFLNNDATAQPDWLAELLAPLDVDAGVAASTSRILLAADGRINNAGGAVNTWGVGYDRGYGEPYGPPYDVATEVGFFCGGACALRTSMAREVGGFPVPYFLYYEDTDLSWRLGLAGWRIRYAPNAVVHHLHSASSDQGSVLFAFHNQRNQLLTVLRNAPAGLALASIARFLGITVLRVIRPGAEHTQQPKHRLRVLAAVVRLVPSTLAQRREIGRRATVSRRVFRRRWVRAPSDGH